MNLLHQKWKLILFVSFVGLAVFFFIIPRFTHSQGQVRTYKVGLYDNPPKEYLNDLRQAKGLFPDVLNYIAQKENWKLQYVLGSFEDDLANLQKGQLDILVDIDSSSPVRRDMFEFPKETVINSWGIIFVKNGSNINTFTDLNGKKIAVLSSNVYITGPEGILEYLSKFNVKAELVRVPVQADAFDLLNKGQVDAALVDRIFALGNQANYPNIKTTDLFFYPTSLTFALQKNNPENAYLIERIDYWMGRLKDGDNSVYQQILKNNGLSGLTTTQKVFPTWVFYGGLIALGVIAWLILHVYFLRRQRSVAYQKLEESEAFNKSLVEATDRSGIGSIVLQNINGREAVIVSANNMASKISGYPREELLRMTLKDVLPIDVIGSIMERYKLRQEGKVEPYYYETKFINKSGVTVPVVVSPAVIKLNGKEATVVYFMDITETKKTQELLEENEEKFRSVFEKSPLGIALLDEHMRYVSYNKKFADMVGVDPNKLKGKTVADISSSDYHERDKQMAKDLLEGKRSTFKSEEYIVGKNGETFWHTISVRVIRNKQGKFLYFVAMLDDVTKLKNTEEALKVSEKYYRHLSELSPDGIFIHSEGKMVYVNPTAERLLGGKSPDIVGKPVLNFIEKSYKKVITERINKLYAGEKVPTVIEEKLLRLDGKSFDAEVSSAPILYRGRPAVQGVIRDVTARKRYEEALKKNLSLLDSVVNSTADGLLVIDPTGKVEEYNEEFQKLWHIPEKIIKTKDDKKLLGYVLSELKDPKEFLNKVDYLYKHPTEEALDKIEFKDGRIFERYSRPQILDGKIIGRVWSFRDVTTREKSVARLEEEDARQKSIFESMEEGLFVIDKNAKLLMINRKGEQMLGWKRGEMIGREYYNFTLVDQFDKPIPLSKRPLMIALKTGKPYMTNDYSIIVNGRKIDLGVIASPIVVNGELIGALAVFRDIRKEKEVDRAKSEFVSVASHQLRTPLGISKWYLEALKSEDLVHKDPGTAAKYIDVIEDDNERLINLINDLLSVSRIEQFRVRDNPVKSDLTKLTADVVEKLKAISVRKNIKLELKIHGKDHIEAKIDEERYKEVLEVLISNAIRYSYPSKTIRINFGKTDSVMKFSVTNTGIGINKSDRAKIFSKFFRSSEAARMESEGSGLGLFVAKSYIEAWGGAIGFRTVPGKTTTFYFSLPLNKLNITS